MSVLDDMKRRKDQVALEADKLLRINRKQGEINQLNKQLDAVRAQVAGRAYELYQQGVLLPEDLPKLCEQMDELRSQIGNIQGQIEQIKRETLPPQAVTTPCSVCGAALAESAAFCPQCGTPRTRPQQAKTCPNCGQSLPIEAKFCGFCGVGLSAPSVTDQHSAASSTDSDEPDNVKESLGHPFKMLALERSSVNTCYQCGAELATEAAFCPICGTAVP